MTKQPVVNATILIFLVIAFASIGCHKTPSPSSIGSNTEKKLSRTRQPRATIPPKNDKQHKHTQAPEPWNIEGSGQEVVNQLLGYAQMLRVRRPKVSAEQQLNDRSILLKIADRMSKEKLTPEQKLAMFQMKSRSLMAIHSAGNESAKDSLVEMVDAYRDDPEKEVAISADFLDLTIVLSEYLQDDSDTEPLRTKFRELAEKHPDNEVVAKRLNLMSARLLGPGKRECAVQVMRDLGEIFAKSKAANMQWLAPRIHERVHLIESEYDLIVTKAIATRKPEQYLAAAKELVNFEGAGMEVYNETIRSARIMEQFDLYEEARKLNKLIATRFSQHTDPKIANMSERDTRLGDLRLDLAGKPLLLSGVNKDGKAFDQTMIEGKVTLVFFWSADSTVSIRAMQALLSVYSRFKDNGLEIVTMCTDEKVERAINVFGDRHPPWINLYSSNEAYQEMLKKSGIQMVPYVILLDRDSKVDRIHIPLRDLEPNLLRLLGTTAKVNSEETK